jgi:hypothetical protein
MIIFTVCTQNGDSEYREVELLRDLHLGTIRERRNNRRRFVV